MRRMAGLVVAAATLWSAGLVAAQDLRVASYNASLSRDAPGALLSAVTAGEEQVARVARIIRAADADVILINEFDHDPDAAEAFVIRFLDGMGYAYSFISPVNTGLPTGFDLNQDGEVGTEGFALANDAHGFGTHTGQYGMLILSRHPLGEARTFREFLWRDMPGARLPQVAGDSYYSEATLDVLRLSSKSHWDVPVVVDGSVVHILASHPTPPVFDGPEDRNGTRNADEIRFWAEYIDGAGWITDDAGRPGGLPEGAHFVIAGDLNSDPLDGDSLPGAAQQLLEHPSVNTRLAPASEGAVIAAARQGGANAAHRGDPAFDTADYGDDPARSGPGNLRADYVLPSATLQIAAAGVIWPGPGEPLDAASRASDHRLVWIDLHLPE